MSAIPTFHEINKKQKTAGTYDLYASTSGVGANSFPSYKTATLTICRWEAYGKKTRVHRYTSEAKIRVSKAEAAISVPIILRAIAHLNSDIPIADKRKAIDLIEQKKWSILAETLKEDSQ